MLSTKLLPGNLISSNRAVIHGNSAHEGIEALRSFHEPAHLLFESATSPGRSFSTKIWSPWIFHGKCSFAKVIRQGTVASKLARISQSCMFLPYNLRQYLMQNSKSVLTHRLTNSPESRYAISRVEICGPFSYLKNIYLKGTTMWSLVLGDKFDLKTGFERANAIRKRGHDFKNVCLSKYLVLEHRLHSSMCKLIFLVVLVCPWQITALV